MSSINHLTRRRNPAKAARLQVIVPTHAHLNIKMKGQSDRMHARTKHTHSDMHTHRHTHRQTEQVNYFISNY